jgi:hypothetical protein
MNREPEDLPVIASIRTARPGKNIIPAAERNLLADRREDEVKQGAILRAQALRIFL